jgi:cystathionine beta-lyase/cystathionine gamma-synthase
MRSLETLPLRMARHCENALKVARFLEAHPKVTFVRYPGLKSHPQHAMARKQMTGFGGMLNFGLNTEKALYFKLLERLTIITHAVSLGHTESLIMFYPQEGNHPELGVLNYPEDLGGCFLRMSVGLEDADDLIADLKQALEAVPASRKRSPRG